MPDSRTPRRFAVVSSTTATTATRTLWSSSGATAVAAYCAAEEIETATVST